MSYRKIKNPLSEDLRLLYKGENFVLEAKSTKEFSDDVANQFEHIYDFLKQDVVEDEVVETEPVKVSSDTMDEPKKDVKKTPKKK